MYLMTNRAVAEMIPFSLSNIFHHVNLLECVVLVGVILIPGAEDEHLVLVNCKQLRVFLIHQILVGLISSIG